MDEYETFFYGDTVARVSSKNDMIKYGLVIARDFQSPMALSTHRKCFTVVWYPSGIKKTVLADKLLLINRSVVAGDTIRKLNENETSSFGICQNVYHNVTVKILGSNNTRIIENIDHRNLTRINQFYIDDRIMYNSYVGQITKVQSEIKFAFEDGSIFTLVEPYKKFLIKLSENDKFKFKRNGYYRGQKIRMHFALIAKANFITLGKFMRRHWINYEINSTLFPRWINVYVLDISVVSVKVARINKNPTPIEETIKGDELKKITVIDLIKWRNDHMIGDLHWYTINDTDNLIPMGSMKYFSNKNSLFPRKGHGQYIKIGRSSVYTLRYNRLKRLQMWNILVKANIKKMKKYRIPKISIAPNSNVIVQILHTETTIDVQYQDGTKEKKVSSVDVCPILWNNKEHEYYPGDFVTESSKARKHFDYGIIESTNNTECIARVQLFNFIPNTFLIPIPAEKMDFSIYDLVKYHRFTMKPGYHVVKSDFASVNLDKLNTSMVGQVLGHLPDGKVSVMWITGNTTDCWPLELYYIDYKQNYYQHYQQAANYISDINIENKIKNLSTTMYEYLLDYEDDDDFEDWISIDSIPESFKKNYGFMKNILHEKPCLKTSTEVISNVLSLNENVEKLYDIIDMVIKYQIDLEQLRSKISDDDYSEIKLKDLQDKVKNIIEKSNFKVVAIDNGKPAFKTSIEDRVNNLQQIISDIIDQCFETNSLNSNHSIIGVENLVDMPSKTDVIESKGLPVVQSDNNTDFNIWSVNKDIGLESQAVDQPERIGVFIMEDRILDNAHKFINDPTDSLNKRLLKVINKDIQILQYNLPAGIWVKTFENRMDLFCAMIRGPDNTPYSGGLFMFDIKIPSDYPIKPPNCYYHNFCEGNLNPNLYANGKICLSLLGTWRGHGVENWSPQDSNILQILISIQGLILVSEPYFNEPAFDPLKNSKEKSRLYNEAVLIKVVQSMTNLLIKINRLENVGHFRQEILKHVKFYGPKLIKSIKTWICMSGKVLTEDEKCIPGYPLLPVSKGFCLSMNKELVNFRSILISMKIIDK